MEEWRIGINWTHVAAWRRGLIGWLLLVGFALLVGPKARPDELLFALVLPAVVVVPYVVLCALVAGLRLIRWQYGMTALRILRHLRLRKNA